MEPRSNTRTVKLLPLFRSENQAKLLTALVLSGKPLSVGELAKYANIGHSTALHALNTLVVSGILSSKEEGRKHLFTLDIEGKLLEIITDLVNYTYGPKDIITESFLSADYIKSAYIYGSWAARYNQVPGPVPNDIDLIIVGSKLKAEDKNNFENKLDILENKLFRDINPHFVSKEDWETESSEFIKKIKNSPLLIIKG